MDIEIVKNAVNEFFSDTSRSPSQTRSDLLDLMDEIRTMVDSIEETSEPADDEG